MTRGFYGSTAATHSNAATIDIITVARLEGDDSDPGHTTDLGNPYNYSQIRKELSVSGTEAVISQYGSPPTVDDLQKILGRWQWQGGQGPGWGVAHPLGQHRLLWQAHPGQWHQHSPHDGRI